MATTTQIRIRARPAHTIGTTRLAYTPDGTKLVTVGATDFARVFRTRSDGEPTTVDGLPEDNLAVDATVGTLGNVKRDSANIATRMSSL